MGYNTNGSSHRDGVQNEHNTIDLVNDNPNCRRIYDVTGRLEHRGGTRNHADAVNERVKVCQLRQKPLKRVRLTLKIRLSPLCRTRIIYCTT